VAGTMITCAGISPVITAFGYDAVACQNAAGGGCLCTAVVNQTGGMGLVSMDPLTSGLYTTAGNTVTLDGDTSYSYCVSGSRMTWTPQSTGATTTGTIVLQKG
ncbi:MAG TPA: hypothetical protein VF518_01175, partial [Polyangia bacterium]